MGPVHKPELGIHQDEQGHNLNMEQAMAVIISRGNHMSDGESDTLESIDMHYGNTISSGIERH